VYFSSSFTASLISLSEARGQREMAELLHDEVVLESSAVKLQID
jgi:hypothetical protein